MMMMGESISRMKRKKCKINENHGGKMENKKFQHSSWQAAEQACFDRA